MDIEVDPSFPTNLTMGLPDPEDVGEEGYGCFRDVWTMGNVPRREALAMIKEERHLMGLVDQASRTDTDFEAIAKAVESGEVDYLPAGHTARYPDSELVRIIDEFADEGAPLDGLDLGVAGLTYALSCSGCFTAASCRSHRSDHSWTDHPVIFFAAERSTVQWLTPMVRESGCGFADGSDRGDRLLVVEAPSTRNFMDLATRITQKPRR
ncbi:MULTISPECIES: hypothetical protein [unclassified Streptomyces]|uniref:hypothetical protein n=1 Tax=unclassified Streptomyces TaxID=2593676 RepID=UPI002E170CE5|nr:MULTISPECIES: hypothetical protein [unclassified Streptomyces]